MSPPNSECMFNLDHYLIDLMFLGLVTRLVYVMHLIHLMFLLGLASPLQGLHRNHLLGTKQKSRTERLRIAVTGSRC